MDQSPPSDRLKKSGQDALIGVISPRITELAEKPSADDVRFADQGHQKLLADDEIVAVNGSPLPRDEATGKILSFHLETLLAQHVAQPLTLTVQRVVRPDGQPSAEGTTEKFDVVLPPTRLRVLGLSMKGGPIVGVRDGTPAKRAGLLAGDVLLTLNGEDIGDPLTLPQRLLPLAGQEIEVRVQRQDEQEPRAFRLTPEPPETTGEGILPSGSLVGVDSLGLALRVENVVQTVDPDGPAARAGLQAGDEITKAQFYVADPAVRKKTAELFGRDHDKAKDLSAEQPNWPYVHGRLQNSLPGTEVRLSYRRDGKEKTASLTPVDSNRWYWGGRGLILSPLTEIRTADSWTESFALGYRETKEKLQEVFVVLWRLITARFGRPTWGGRS